VNHGGNPAGFPPFLLALPNTVYILPQMGKGINLNTPLASTRLSLVANILLFLLKITAGIFGRSQALVADSLNSLLDIVANIAVWFGINIARKPPDKEHPYGHGNADTLAAVFVALILLITGGYIGREAVGSIISGNFTAPTLLATGAALFTIILKSLLYKYTLSIGKKYKSAAVIANAQDHLSDVVVSAGTLVGIIMAQVKFPILDPIAGLWVAFFILKQAIRIIQDNVHTLMGASPDFSIQNEIRDHIKQIDGVITTNWIKGRRVGAGYYLDVALIVKANMTVREGHDIAHLVKESVMNSFHDVADVMVHIEPDDSSMGRL